MKKLILKNFELMEKFQEDFEEDTYEEEEILVHANFEEGAVDKKIFQQSDLELKIIGLDSDTPILQLGETSFKGTWNDTIGTKVYFEEDSSPEQLDPVFTVIPSKMLKYKCMTTKTLDCSRIFLKPKNGVEKNLTPTGENPSFNFDRLDPEFVNSVQDTDKDLVGNDTSIKEMVE